MSEYDEPEEFEDELTVAEAEVAEAAAAVESDLSQLEGERAELVDTLRRVQADFENYRKRVLREQTALVERATERLVEDLLPVLDSFDGALGSLAGADSPETEKVRDGVLGIHAQLVSALEKAGLERIEADGAPFDPNEHEAVLQDSGARRPARGGDHAHRLPPEGPRAAPRDGPGVPRRGMTRWHRRGSGSTRTTTPSSACRPTRPRRTSPRLPQAGQAVPPRRQRGRQAAEDRFKEISAAHDVLGDAEKRKEYDEVREMVASGVGPGGPGGFGGFGGGGPGGFGNVRVEDLGDLGDLGGLFGNLFGGRGGRRGRSARPGRPQRGNDIETELHLDFLDAVHGITTSVNITSEAPCSRVQRHRRQAGHVPRRAPRATAPVRSRSTRDRSRSREVCPNCGGRGSVIKDKCKNCKGRGIEVRPRTVKVRIPAGVDDGQRIRVKGRGTPGLNGGPPGDLYVVVHVAPHPIFARSGKWDLTVKVPITFPEAVLGAQVKVPTLDAPVTVKVPPGTQTRQDRPRATGAASSASGDPGALLVTFDVVVPHELDDDARAAVEELATAAGNPREHLGV